jgi:hypothetical protein
MKRPDDLTVHLLVVADRRELNVSGGDVRTAQNVFVALVERSSHRRHQR